MLLRCAASDFCVILRPQFAVSLCKRLLGSHRPGFGSRIESGDVLSLFYEICEFNHRVGRPILLSELAIKTVERQ